SSPLEDQVKRALVHPIHRGSLRIHTHNYISFYEKDKTGNDLLLKLSKLDFNYVQNMHKRDICQVSRWWNELKSSFPYVRDRIAEACLWGTTFHFEPQYSYVRKTIAKTIQILTMLDETYDIYATVEEADLFTESLQRWNIDEIHPLPDYMKIIYRIILSTYEDYERDAAEHGKLFAAPCAKEVMKQVCKAYNKEIKWTKRQELPCFEEYIENSVMAGCLFAICSTTIPGMKYITKETVDWLMSVPKIVVASSTLGRYLDDVNGYKGEIMEGKYLIGVDYYMKQHDVSLHEAKEKFIELAENEWKGLNKEWTSVPKDMLE
ncbi:cis-muuroladiene synthase, partial [Phtheirospermum japonicum]